MRKGNRCHVALRQVDDDKNTSFQEEIENSQHGTGIWDLTVPFRPLLQHISSSHITGHLRS